jgi:hypothetical protein
MSSFTAYRNPNARSGSLSEDGSKDAKAAMRESRLIQDEHWQSPEIQKAFEKVNKTRYAFEKMKIICLFKGTIDFSDVHSVLTQLGIKIQKFEVMDILGKHEKSKQAQLTKEEFEDVSQNIFFS